jgi:hypothetical protein
MKPANLADLAEAHHHLSTRAQRYDTARDGSAIFREAGFKDLESVALMPVDAFNRQLEGTP